MNLRPRFSLRTLLIVTALVAVACWWVVRPTIFAQRFAAAIAAGDLAAADALCADPNRRFVNRAAYYFRPQGSVNANSGGTTRIPPIDIVVELSPWTWADFWRGQRRIVLHLSEVGPAGLGGAGTAINTLGQLIRPGTGESHALTATTTGIIPPQDPTPAWSNPVTHLNPNQPVLK